MSSYRQHFFSILVSPFQHDRQTMLLIKLQFPCSITENLIQRPISKLKKGQFFVNLVAMQKFGNAVPNFPTRAFDVPPLHNQENQIQSFRNGHFITNKTETNCIEFQIIRYIDRSWSSLFNFAKHGVAFEFYFVIFLAKLFNDKNTLPE